MDIIPKPTFHSLSQVKNNAFFLYNIVVELISNEQLISTG